MRFLFEIYMEEYLEKLKVRLLDIETGQYIAMLNEEKAREMGLFPTDRIDIRNPGNGNCINCVVDFTNSIVGNDEIGIFEDAQKILKLRKGQYVEVLVAASPSSLVHIKRKMDGKKLTAEEIKKIVADIGSNKLSDIEVSAFMSSVYIRGFDLDETVAMTKALVENGKIIKISKRAVLDKHSIGGTNGRVTMVMVPIVAAAGYYMPKTSSRSITSSAGTADAMEVLCDVKLSLEEIKKITEEVGAVIAWGGAVDLAPADDKIIKIEHPLSLDPPGQVIASVLAKKASVGAGYVVIDLPVGSKVKIKDEEQAEEMAEKFIEVGRRMGMKVEVVLTDGAEPVGQAFGPALEAKYVMETLEGKRYDTLAEKSCELAGVLFELVGKSRQGEGKKLAEEILKSGKALEKMKEIIRAQKGTIFSSEEVKLGKFKKTIDSKVSGEIKDIDVRLLNTIARIAGAPGDKKAGVMLLVERGGQVKKGDPLFEIYAENKRKIELAEAFALTNQVIDLDKLILGRFG